MSDQPTLNKFRKPTTNGSDHTSIELPSALRLTISQKGLTDRAAEVRIRELQNQKNEWNALEAEAQVHEAKEKAHGAAYNAMSAEINAATSLLGAKEAFWKHETAQVNEVIAHAERDMKVASLPLHQAKLNTELKTLVLQLEDLELELKKLDEDVTHTKVMNQLNGYAVDIQIPQITLPKFDALKLKGGQNGQQ